MFSGCTNTEQESNSPYTVIDSVLGSRTVGDGCVYHTIRHTDGTQSISVMDTKNCTMGLLNEETELNIVEDSFGGIFYADGFLYRVLNIGDYQEIEQFTADGEYIKELIINNDTEFWIDHYRTPVIFDGEKLYFDGKVRHDRWDSNNAILSFDPATITLEAVYEFTEGDFIIAGVYKDCFILNSTVPNPHPEVDKEYISVVELLNIKTFEREVLFENIYEGEYAGNKWFQLDSERIYTSFSFNDMPVYNIKTRESSTLPIHSEGDGYHYVFSITEPEDDRTMVWTSSADYTKHSYYMYNLKTNKKTAVYESTISGKPYPSVYEYVDGYYLVSMGREKITAQSGIEVDEPIYAWIKADDLYNGKMNLEYITNTVEYK
jgi:hypothetical protein